MIRKYLKVLALTLLSVISIGCATLPAAQQEAVKQETDKYVANFDYTPASQEKPGSAGVTFAVGKVSYKSSSNELSFYCNLSNRNINWFSYPQFVNLDKAIKQDLPKLLTAKGFNVRGPFDSYDLIPYSDKKVIDLILVTTLRPLITFYDCNQELCNYKGTSRFEVYTGNVEVSGGINLELREIVTGELMWHKSIPLTKFKFPYNFRFPCPVTYPEGTTPFDFNPIMNDVAKGIEQQYPDFMTTVSKFIDPEEMQIIKKQAREIRSKKGY